MVGNDSPAISARVFWSIPSNARAAFIWKEVIMRSIHIPTIINDVFNNESDVKNIKRHPPDIQPKNTPAVLRVQDGGLEGPI